MMNKALFLFVSLCTLLPVTSFAKRGGVDGGGGDAVVVGDQAPVFADRFVDPDAQGTGFITGDFEELDDNSGEPLKVDSFSDDLRFNLMISDLAALQMGVSVSDSAPPAELRGFNSELFAGSVVSPDIRVHWVESLPDLTPCNLRSEGLHLPEGAKKLPLGCTIGLHTWVIKSLYDKMAAEDQALFWIHEGLQRYYPKSIIVPGQFSPIQVSVYKSLLRIPVFVRAVGLTLRMLKSEWFHSGGAMYTPDQILAQAPNFSAEECKVLDEASKIAIVGGLNLDVLRKETVYGDSVKKMMNDATDARKHLANGGGILEIQPKTLSIAPHSVVGVFASLAGTDEVSLGDGSELIWGDVDGTRITRIGAHSFIEDSNVSSNDTAEIGDNTRLYYANIDLSAKPSEALKIGNNVDLSYLNLSGSVDLTIEDGVKLSGTEDKSPDIHFSGSGSSSLGRLFGKSKTSVLIKKGTVIDFSHALCGSGNNFNFSDAQVVITSADDLKKYCD